MIGESNTPPSSWNSRREERYLIEFEDSFCRDLVADMTFPDVARDFPQRLAKLVQNLPSGFRTEFLVDLICSANCLCLRTWRDYVSNHWKQVPAEVLLDQLHQVPNIPKYLSALGLGTDTVKKFPTLAREDLKARNAYADGGRSEDYEAMYGCVIPQAEHRLFVAPKTNSIIFELLERGSTDYTDFVGSSYMDDHDSMRRTLKRFPLIQRLSVGRQKSREPSPFEMVFGESQHRLIIADKKDVKEVSREQLTISVLSPQFIYVKNNSDHFPIDCLSNGRFKRLLHNQSIVRQSDITISCNKLLLDVFQLDHDRTS
jgi:hypothetical protein